MDSPQGEGGWEGVAYFSKGGRRTHVNVAVITATALRLPSVRPISFVRLTKSLARAN